MRISRLAISIVLIAFPAAFAAAEGTTSFSSAQEALKQGINAYNGGYYEIAIPALEYAAAKDEFMAEYYLARIYADNTGSYTDHAKAYRLFQRIADEHIDADSDDPRAPYVGKSLTALAGYVRVGLPEIGLGPDPKRAVFYLNNALTTFNDQDAQFELAKLQLKGDGLETNVPLGKHWLSVLSQNGHAGAQAFLADLLWRGKYMEADQARALALISIAVQNAPPHERLWIEDIYQNIFCGAAEGTRRQATGIAAQWGNPYGRNPDKRATPDLLEQLTGAPERTCQNGERVAAIPIKVPSKVPIRVPIRVSMKDQSDALDQRGESGVLCKYLDSPPAASKSSSVKEALKQGISAYNRGDYEVAIPALESAATQNEFMAKYYLARIYANNLGSHKDHVRACTLFQSIADEHIDADPDEDPRAPYVGKSLTALAGYARVGLPEIGLKPDPKRAVFFLKNAAEIFNDQDAQFELGKLQLSEGSETIPLGRYWLRKLRENGHAGAQAYYADLLWRGTYVDADHPHALAWGSKAVENASPDERLSIGDIYKNIFCGADEGIRKQAIDILTEWGNRYDRNAADPPNLLGQPTPPALTCQNGERVAPLSIQSDNNQLAERATERATPEQQLLGAHEPTYGSMGGQGTMPRDSCTLLMVVIVNGGTQRLQERPSREFSSVAECEEYVAEFRRTSRRGVEILHNCKRYTKLAPAPQ